MQKIANDNPLPIEIVSYIDANDDRNFILSNSSHNYKNGFRVGGAKLTIDGSPQGFTAYRDRPYYKPT